MPLFRNTLSHNVSLCQTEVYHFLGFSRWITEVWCASQSRWITQHGECLLADFFFLNSQGHPPGPQRRPQGPHKNDLHVPGWPWHQWLSVLHHHSSGTSPGWYGHPGCAKREHDGLTMYHPYDGKSLVKLMPLTGKNWMATGYTSHIWWNWGWFVIGFSTWSCVILGVLNCLHGAQQGPCWPCSVGRSYGGPNFPGEMSETIYMYIIWCELPCLNKEKIYRWLDMTRWSFYQIFQTCWLSICILDG